MLSLIKLALLSPVQKARSMRSAGGNSRDSEKSLAHKKRQNHTNEVKIDPGHVNGNQDQSKPENALS